MIALKEIIYTLFNAAISQHSIRAMTFNQTKKSRGRRTMVYHEIHKGIAAVLRVSILLSPIYRKVCRTSRNPSSTYRKWKAMDLDGHIFALKAWLTMQPVLEHPGFKFQIFIDMAWMRCYHKIFPGNIRTSFGSLTWLRNFKQSGDEETPKRRCAIEGIMQTVWSKLLASCAAVEEKNKYQMCQPNFLWPAWTPSQLETEQAKHSDMSQIRQLVVKKTFPGRCLPGSSRTLQKRVLFGFTCKTEPDGTEKPLCMLYQYMMCNENLNPSKFREHF
ncbi:hypothetical protein T10_2889 [Trichinella papuae]|uniref:Uncharacterized protein n=1 Tax=Trichinella papuae TaxID=268474 RepID=A0A0V1N8M9_9BILA|nr:hypothetical protein T10_2889 [Trichinella papuae]